MGWDAPALGANLLDALKEIQRRGLDNRSSRGAPQGGSFGVISCHANAPSEQRLAQGRRPKSIQAVLYKELYALVLIPVLSGSSC